MVYISNFIRVKIDSAGAGPIHLKFFKYNIGLVKCVIADNSTTTRTHAHNEVERKKKKGRREGETNLQPLN